MQKIISYYRKNSKIPKVPSSGSDCIELAGNVVSIMVLTSKDIDLKPSFANILICLVRPLNLSTRYPSKGASKNNHFKKEICKKLGRKYKVFHKICNQHLQK